MIDQIPIELGIPLAIALWALLLTLHVRDRRRDPRPITVHMSLDCLSRIHGGCQVCDCQCHTNQESRSE